MPTLKVARCAPFSFLTSDSYLTHMLPFSCSLGLDPLRTTRISASRNSFTKHAAQDLRGVKLDRSHDSDVIEDLEISMCNPPVERYLMSYLNHDQIHIPQTKLASSPILSAQIMIHWSPPPKLRLESPAQFSTPATTHTKHQCHSMAYHFLVWRMS